ncbi:four-helix bundle copper-binding protein [Sphingobacterium daejeonense]|uniref:four-helix bundle copper-binding protein n=2 Tax=Sphingobacteriaceae TaxID=84566 RepID=UPI0010C4A6E7|nr:four-helix bundle copper-binding protein [Sphingobacterium daejeonense]VTP93194.1 Domain of Uncharacterised Function (DUF326) [Sphingobacterium daejeonense]
MNQDSLVKACIDETQKCAVACLECAQTCLNEKDLEMLRECIKTDLECAEICEATSKLLIMDSSSSKELVKICLSICEACAAECEKHAEHGMEHCRKCAEACRKCADACRKLVA